MSEQTEREARSPRSGTRTTTVRLPEELMHDAELIARVDGVSFSELVRRAIAAHLSSRGLDVEFRARLRDLVARDQRILDRLTSEPRDESSGS